MGIEDIFTMQDETEAVAPEIVETVEQPEVVEPVIEEALPEVIAPVVEEVPKTVPLATFLDQRDELKEYKRKIAEYEAAKPVEQPAAPDPFDDPQAYAAYQRQEVQAAVMGQKFEMSDLIARQSHGDEVVETATAWAMEKAKANPAFAAEYMKERHPIDWIVRQHKRDSVMQQIGEDPDEFVRRRAVELGLTATTQEAAPVAPVLQQTAATPARSLASSPSLNGGVKDVPVGPMTALSALFK